MVYGLLLIEKDKQSGIIGVNKGVEGVHKGHVALG